jgi:predicted PurR-regulated permease PerM
VTTHQKDPFDRDWITATFTDLIIRFCVLAILVYLSLVLVRPFITIVIWSAVLTVAVYPAFDWLALRLGKRRRLAAFLITIFSLLIVIGPAAWLALELIESLRALSERLDPSLISLPPPPEAVKDWPLIGGQIYQSWHLASSNIKAVLVSLAPHLKPLGSTLLRIAADGGTSILQFLISIVVAGFLFCPGPSIVKSVKLFSRRLARDRAEGFVDLAGATIRAVSLGVVGVSVLQALLAGLGLTVAGIPGASVITSAVLILGIVQIGPSIVIIPAIIWSWITMETTAALLFTVYMVPVTLLDNILKPIVMTRGLRTPMLVIVIGVIGGTLGYGITGLFLGPIVLSVIWELITAWMAEGEA